MTRSFAASRLIFVIAVGALLAYLGLGLLDWLESMKAEASQQIESHARQLEVLVS